MPRYRFNVHDGKSSPDEEGTELRDIFEAEREALTLAGALISEAGKHGDLAEDWHLEVTDPTGLLLHRIDVTVTEAPTVMQQRRPRF